MNYEWKILHGQEILPHLEGIAKLRISVFKEFPYLYDGNLDYEKKYLQTYVQCPESVIGLLLLGNEYLGATTGLPMEFESAEFQKPFTEKNEDLEKIFYFGESVLLPEYRGRGFGKKFFEIREQQAQKLGRFGLTTFCAVERPADHPRKPVDYQTHHAFWKSMGYRQRENYTTEFSWKDLDNDTETSKKMIFWTKPIEPA